MINEEREKIFTHWSPEVESAAGIDDEASLIAESSPVSPPFVKAPIEDRSKYEKLAFNADEVSSDDSDKAIAQRNVDRTKKKRRRIKGVLNRRKKESATQDLNNAPIEYESDDSIGSASDLKAMNDEDCNGDNEDEREEKIDETISESVRTCGSSAYHAECESVATHEDDHRLKKSRRYHRHKETLPTIEADPIVGHQYGEKPLLLDDELDPEAKPEQIHADPFVGHQYKYQKATKLNDSSSDEKSKMKNGIWRIEEDVFAMAPFPRSSSSRKSSLHSLKNPSVDNSPQNSTPVVTSSPIISTTLVNIDDDDDDNFNQENKDLFGSSPFATFKPNPFNNIATYNNYSEERQEYFPDSSFVTSMSKFGRVTVQSTLPPDQKDLFGSIPFEELNILQERPNSLPLSQSPNFVDNALTSILSTSVQSEQQFTRQMEHATRITIQATNSVSRTDLNSDIVSPMSPEPLMNDSPKFRKEKLSKTDKSRYHLINENRNDCINVLPAVKMAHKNKGSSFKKTPKGKKSPSVATAGVSNMSFEDFPSDENNDDRHTSSTTLTPFEVIREPEKRFGSLKRRSNPFT